MDAKTLNTFSKSFEILFFPLLLSFFPSLLSFWVSNCTQRFGLYLLFPVGLQSSPLCFQLRLWLRTQGHMFWMLFSLSCLFCNTLFASPSHFRGPAIWVSLLSPARVLLLLLFGPPCPALQVEKCSQGVFDQIQFCFCKNNYIRRSFSLFSELFVYISILFTSFSRFRDSNSYYILCFP